MPGNLYELGLNSEQALGELLWLSNHSNIGIPEHVGRIQGILPAVIDARDNTHRLYLGNSVVALDPCMHESIIDKNELHFANCISGMVFMSVSGIHLAIDETDITVVPSVKANLDNEVDSVFIGDIDAHDLTRANLSVVGLMREAATYTRFAARYSYNRRVKRDAFAIYISQASKGFPMYIESCFEKAQFAARN